ncbi:YidB family protein [Variovorax ginsengisoli]|uniref:YidB family protein n=1 Tax=Variovorax ginsengisoli TaxID=363844 RepID=A0ABT8S2R0_9BURK|nr:YidB family protein [Variovorax ginsengisoli]MDN8613618.1 YidB family protein [Variovorax ginsengisoli]MDO1532788.1 YidB family protein [Variovorax ginsengisoli]
MGLLTQILGGLAGNALGGSQSHSSRGGMSPVLMALLPVVLNMLSQRGHAGGLGAGPASGGGEVGGPGGLAGMGGLGGLLEQFTQKGYGSQAESWVGTGANQALPPNAIDDIFGRDQLHQIAQQAGLGDDETRSGLSELLPDVVDHFTPGGQVPEQNQLSSSVDNYLQAFR